MLGKSRFSGQLQKVERRVTGSGCCTMGEGIGACSRVLNLNPSEMMASFGPCSESRLGDSELTVNRARLSPSLTPLRTTAVDTLIAAMRKGELRR